MGELAIYGPDGGRKVKMVEGGPLKQAVLPFYCQGTITHFTDALYND